MPYVFDPDCLVLNDPTPEDLRRTAATLDRHRGLMLLGYRGEDFAALRPLTSVTVLKVRSAGQLTRLSGLESLASLRTLVIGPPTSWESNARTLDVDSYRTLASLKSLESLHLMRVRPLDDDLSPIAGMRHLRDLEIAGVPSFALADFARLSTQLPETTGRCLQPYVQIPGVGVCSKCKGPQVMLTAAPPRSRRWLCPVCNQAKLNAHVAAWNAAC